MKKLSILFLLICASAFAQDSTSIGKFKRWSIGLAISPDYSYRLVRPIVDTNKYVYALHKQCVDSVNSIEKAAISYTIGIPIGFRFNKHFALKTGFYLSNKAFKAKGFVWGNSIWDGYAIFQSTKFKKSNFYFWEIPLTIEFTKQSKKYSKYSFKAFVGTIFCMNSKETEYSSRRWWMEYAHPELEDSYKKLKKFKSLFWGATFGFGANYKLSEKLILSAEPVLKFYLKDLKYPNNDIFNQQSTQWMGIYETPYSIGCNVSVSYLF